MITTRPMATVVAHPGMARAVKYRIYMSTKKPSIPDRMIVDEKSINRTVRISVKMEMALRPWMIKDTKFILDFPTYRWPRAVGTHFHGNLDRTIPAAK